MSDPNHRWAEELEQTFEGLKTVRDEVKVQAHLLGMEAKQRFAALEQRLDNEQLNVRKNLEELMAGFRQLKADVPAPPR